MLYIFNNRITCIVTFVQVYSIPISVHCIRVRVAKFDLKVGSRRTTNIQNLVVLIIILVVLILLPYYMWVVLVLILHFFTDMGKIYKICWDENCWVNSFTKNRVVRRTTRPQYLVVLTYFLIGEDA